MIDDKSGIVLSMYNKKGVIQKNGFKSAFKSEEMKSIVFFEVVERVSTLKFSRKLFKNPHEQAWSKT